MKDEPAQDSFQRLLVAANGARTVLNRVAGEGSVIRQIERGEWSGALTAQQATDVADLIGAMTEQVRYTRAVAGDLRESANSEALPSADRSLGAVLETGLPLNRKERYYTGTVLPMIVAGDGFAHLYRLLALCGLPLPELSGNPLEGPHQIEFFTEYNFVESRYTLADKERFPDAPHDADTPDLVILGRDWLLCIEAKVFHNPPAAALNEQMRRQKVLVDYWTGTLGLDPARVEHVLLLPSGLDSTGVTVPVITWEAVLAAYRTVGPTYWVAVLATALDRYNDLVSLPGTYGRNADDRLTGREIKTLAAEAALMYTHVGRSGGADGPALAQDLATGRWMTQPYEVRAGALPENRNWLPVEDFLARLPATP